MLSGVEEIAHFRIISFLSKSMIIYVAYASKYNSFEYDKFSADTNPLIMLHYLLSEIRTSIISFLHTAIAMNEQK